MQPFACIHCMQAECAACWRSDNFLQSLSLVTMALPACSAFALASAALIQLIDIVRRHE